ncbi:SDR family NAD(P)-dependent oxidoreductase [Gluconacetobacter azotocaptans]|uniref:SDR family NAD(P)-dependent oxidoreductase n=1 Tax=Gluconacetobacter azotocaptans TaxID=142834 RepID=A0A7W4JTY0_9PROT|nr:SDR family NAD(P)-dependent oxidoreductase [Gluconacetobacter azotocaptans]MBB2190794.1 SDR family NAD(P)-dependent oxidoreductase [Gluconacetobacter azotocaptans]MBM9400760.1 SDR family NAD(P)-dependent oxidoreductase [Gluconacetobacter azotocaptans]GBQ30803.1 dehydrogenase [Gluconacetobacter azotocaptans DSM 13594]
MQPPPDTATRRVAMISGASRGIGAAIAERLVSDGWLISAGLRDPGRPPFSAPHLVHAYDATDPGAERQWTEATLARFGRIDAVIASAGIMIPGSLLELEDSDLDRMFQVNVRAPARLIKAAWPALRATGHGRIVILSSMSGKRVKSPRSGLYAVTKFAATGLAAAVRRTGWADGIRSIVVCPSFVSTDMTRDNKSWKPEDMTQPADIASMISHALDLPNTASVSELCFTCQDEDLA